MKTLNQLAETRPEALALELSKKRSAGNADAVAETLLLMGHELVAAIHDLGAELRQLRVALAPADAAERAPSTARTALVNALECLFRTEGLSDLEAPAGELLERIRAHATYRDRISAFWPRNPRSLSVTLKRLLPEFAERGFLVEQGAGDQRRTWSIRRNRATAQEPSESSPT